MARLCPKCGSPLDANGFCSSCNISITVYNKIQDTSKVLYNQGLQKAKVRDLSGAIDLLNRSIRMDKTNTDARNLLGLIFFEIGETVTALQQWVISKNLKPDNNDAVYFINKIQNNQSYLDRLNTAIKKYNQSLTYIEQNSVDLAIIQLKKVISLNPKFVKAFCLLALCYIKEEQPDRAKKTLVKVLQLDKSNYVARKYLDALNEDALSSDDFIEHTESAATSTPLGKKFSINNAVFQFVAMAVGVVIGLSVMSMLVMPSRISEKEQETAAVEKQVEELNGIKTNLEDKIALLEASVTEEIANGEALQVDITDKQAELDEISKLVTAFEYYVVDDLVQAADALYVIDNSMLAEDVQIVYSNLTAEIYPAVALSAYQSGYNDYQARRYESSIENLEIAYKYEKADYYSDETLYFLARSYQKMEELDKALTIFKKMLEEYPEATKKADAEYFVRVLEE